MESEVLYREKDRLINVEGECSLYSESSEKDSSCQEKNGPVLQKKLTLVNSISFVISNLIGSGIFITPTLVLQYSGSFGMSLVFWLVGGLIALASGLTYIELATLITDSGGEYAYLKEGFSFNGRHPALTVLGKAIGFMFVWCCYTLSQPLALAIMAEGFATYLCRALAGGATPPMMSVKMIAVSAIILVTFINVYSLRLLALVTNILSLFKLLALVFIIALGVWKLIDGDHIDNFKDLFEGVNPCPGDTALALYSVLFAYSGWNVLSSTVEESTNVYRNLSIGLIVGIPLVCVCYLLVNISYYAGLSKADLLSSPATALTFAEAVMGKAGLVVIPLMVSASTFGSATVTSYSAPRMAFSASRDGNLPEVFSLLQDSSKLPVAAILFHSFLSVVFVLIGTMVQLLSVFNMVEWFFVCLVMLSLIIMRFTKRRKKRIFKIWIIVPVLMIIVALFLVIAPLVLVPNQRVTSIIALSLILFSLPVYFIFVWEGFPRPNLCIRTSENVTCWVGQFLEASSARRRGCS